jgi:hypothetical protein
MLTNSFGNRNFTQPMGRLSMHSKCLDLFFLSFGARGGEDFFHFSFVPNKFPSSSQWVPIRFPMCSPRVFPIAPRFNPICFAQSPPLLTYIGGPKGKALYLYIESSILGAFHRFNFFLWWANHIGSLQKKKKVGLVRHPQPINIKQNK